MRKDDSPKTMSTLEVFEQLLNDEESAITILENYELYPSYFTDEATLAIEALLALAED